jgi:multidrug resistance efflux pump
MNHKIRLMVLLGVGAGAPSAWYWQRASVSPPANEEQEVWRYPAEKWISGTGRVEPVSEVRRLAFRTGGIVDKCLCKIGDVVKEGDSLITLRNEQEALALAVAKSEVALAQAERDQIIAGVNAFRIAAAQNQVDYLREQVRHLRTEYDRTQRLFARTATSDSERERARSSLVQHLALLGRAEAECKSLQNFVTPENRQLAISKVSRAEAQLELEMQRYRDTHLVAPCDGTVLEILKHPGDRVTLTDTEPVLVFSNLSRLQIRAEIDERHARDVKKGQKATIYGRGLGREAIPGKVSAVRNIMGKRTLWTKAATERMDLEVLQVLIESDALFRAPVWLQVDVRIFIE